MKLASAENGTKESKVSVLHRCPECPATADRITNIKGHFASIHRREEMLKLAGTSGVDCTLCFRKYTNQHSLFYHLANSHDTLKGVFSEAKSKKPQRRLNSVSAGSIQTTAKQVHPCPKCSQHFEVHTDLLCHMATEHFKNVLLESYSVRDSNCSECTNLYRSNSQDDLAKHLAAHHLELSKHLPALGQNKMDCAFCGKSFKKACGWIIHERACHLKNQSQVAIDQVVNAVNSLW